jgi:pyridoxal phosphate enzyme (YggS family)
MTTATSIAERLATVQREIAVACERAERDPADVTLVAVSKTHPAEAVAEAVRAGAVDLGENWAQEFVPKAEAVAAYGLSPRWHFIGHLQRNKVRDVLPHIGSLHSLDSPRLAEELERRIAQREGAPLDCYIEVNVAGEGSKTGIDPGEVTGLLQVASRQPHLHVVGLMTVAPETHDAESVRPVFRRLRGLAQAHGLAGLSMGMSGDYRVAIEEGSTLVRIGTAIFGPRRA